MSIPDGHEAYIEIQGDWGRLAGGNRDEVEAYWERTKHTTGACKSRLVVGDQVTEERSIGSERLRKRVARRLTEGADDDDRELIAEMAELLGMRVDEMEHGQ